VRLLGGFRVELVGTGAVAGWQLRKAKTLTKLLATLPAHAIHREQVLEILWPDADPGSALNSFGKTLHAARRAFEPDRTRGSSSYLRLVDGIVALELDNVVVDADRFQELAESALQQPSVTAHRAALAAYGGELLPEDRYEDWVAERRDFLAALHRRVLLGLAEALESHGALGEAADGLRTLLQQDPTNEDVHRRLMRLYSRLGSRHEAVRQYHACRDAMRRMGLTLERETVVLYETILAGSLHQQSARRAGRTKPLVGREGAMRRLRAQLDRAHDGQGRLILVSGEGGVGKTRLVSELAAEARYCGACVLCGGGGGHTDQLAYGPLALALERYAASRPEQEREELARRYPALVDVVPSLPPAADGHLGGSLGVVPAVVRLLSDMARTRTVVLDLGDVDDAGPATLELLRYLAQLAVQRRWLIVGTVREEAPAGGSGPLRLVREGLSLQFELERLARPDCDLLVRALVPSERIADALLEAVYARSLGNPLFVEELVREMVDYESSTLPASAPVRVRARVEMRVSQLDECTRRVLALVAAAGERAISLDELRAGAAALAPPVRDGTVFDALDRALELRILEERDGAYSVRHPLVRAALFEHLSRHRRDEFQAALNRTPVAPSARLLVAAG
jgi:DNA-binding SARP family transcriptional activator